MTLRRTTEDCTRFPFFLSGGSLNCFHGDQFDGRQTGVAFIVVVFGVKDKLRWAQYIAL